jgi:phosphate starvation-inducible protein PhoH and related proteins
MSLRGRKIMYSGGREGMRRFRGFLRHMMTEALEDGPISEHSFRLKLDLAAQGKLDQLGAGDESHMSVHVNGKEVFPQTANQREYVKAMRNHDLVFGIGPAGTGKTFLAVAMALNYFLGKRVERIVLTRPVVEAGERLGFLPGDIQQKINPYLRPLYDALYFFIGFEKTSELVEKGYIEIAPLAYMRGRTINDSFIILDEGQNTVNSQMKMFLTRFGQNSRVVVTADLTQIDLENTKKSGIFQSVRILRRVDGISIVQLTQQDVVRHPLVQRIIEAYDKPEK